MHYISMTSFMRCIPAFQVTACEGCEKALIFRRLHAELLCSASQWLSIEMRLTSHCGGCVFVVQQRHSI